jgi:cell division protein FtsI/penicillin-binding protein 2
MRLVVEQGTAATTFVDNPYRDRIWGKTGSSERPDGSGGHTTDSWFVGVIEPDELDPAADAGPAHHEMAVVCAMPGAGLGGTHAGEVVDRLMRHIARRHHWRPLSPPTRDALAEH